MNLFKTMPQLVLIGARQVLKVTMGTLMQTTRGLELAVTKQKMKQEENAKNEGKSSTALHQQTRLLEKGVEQLNKHTEMLLKQHNEGVNIFFELEAMKYALESDRKDYFQAVLKCTILMEKIWLLESQIEHEQLLKKLDKSKENLAAQEESKYDNDSDVSM